MVPSDNSNSNCDVPVATAPEVPTDEPKVAEFRSSTRKSGSNTVVDFEEGVEFPEEWSDRRISVAKIIASKNFDLVLAVIIMVNILCTVREADVNANPMCQGDKEGPCGTDIMILSVLNNFILFVYGIECLGKLYVLRSQWHHSAWNVFDCVIVLSGIAGELFAGMIPQTSVIRVLRLVRLAKLVRFFIGFRELYLILSGFLSVAKTICWAAILLFLALTVCSVIAVEYIHPINREMDYGSCGWCADAFETVMKSNVTLFQIVIIGDSWGTFAQPLIQESPLAGLLLVTIVLMFTLGFANLIMAVIVEKAFESRSEDMRYQLILQRQEAETIKTKFTEMCRDLDDDGDGTLTLKELVDNYDTNREFLTAMRSMKIDREDLNIVFEVLDADGSGTVAYEEFADNLYKMKSADTTAMLTFIRFNVHAMEKRVAELHRDMLARFESISVADGSAPLLQFDKCEPLQQAGKGHAPLVTCNPLLDSLPIVLPSDSEAIEDHFFQLRDRVQARLAAVTTGAVRRLEHETRALARSAQALASLDNTMPLWAGQLELLPQDSALELQSHADSRVTTENFSFTYVEYKENGDHLMAI